MSLRDLLVPDEIQSAGRAARQMLSVVQKTSYFWAKHAFAAAVPFLVGGLIGYFLSCAATDQTQLEGVRQVVTGILTFVAVLAGFMVTLMLFTGRTEGAKSLSVDDAPIYVEKVTYLLFSQALTLAIHLFCGLFCIAWLMLQSVDVDPVVSQVTLVVTFGLLALSMLRALLLPFQIYEVHHFELDSVVVEKREQFRREMEDAGREPPRSL